jgi:hypothetical protein
VPIGARETIAEQEKRVSHLIFGLLVHRFLSDKNMDAVDSQILDGGPAQNSLTALY